MGLFMMEIEMKTFASDLSGWLAGSGRTFFFLGVWNPEMGE